MGSIRRRLIVPAMLLTPGAAWADACAAYRPGWDGGPVTGVQETILLFGTIPSLVLLLGTALAWRLRSQWGGLIVVVGWTVFVSLATMADITGLQEQAAAEGCIGPRTLFIAIVAAICVATILYTAPVRRDEPPIGEE